MRKWWLLTVLLVLMCGCTMAQLRFWNRGAMVGERIVNSPILDATPLASFAGILGVGLAFIKNLTERKLRERSGDVADERNVLSKMAGSRKYMAASIVSAVLIAVVNYYDLNIDPGTVAKIIAALFGVAIAGNAYEDAAEKTK